MLIANDVEGPLFLAGGNNRLETNSDMITCQNVGVIVNNLPQQFLRVAIYMLQRNRVIYCPVLSREGRISAYSPQDLYRSMAKPSASAWDLPDPKQVIAIEENGGLRFIDKFSL